MAFLEAEKLAPSHPSCCRNVKVVSGLGVLAEGQDGGNWALDTVSCPISPGLRCSSNDLRENESTLSLLKATVILVFVREPNLIS